MKYAKFCKEVNYKKYAYYNFENEKKKLYCRQHKKDDMVNKITKTSIGAKSSFSRLAVVKVVDKLELFMLIFSSKESQLTSCAISSF